ncbi:integrase core domain-containing protein [Mucilaginibacter sp.]
MPYFSTYNNKFFRWATLADEWMEDYNYNRPHEALGSTTPSSYRQLNNK